MRRRHAAPVSVPGSLGLEAAGRRPRQRHHRAAPPLGDLPGRPGDGDPALRGRGRRKPDQGSLDQAPRAPVIGVVSKVASIERSRASGCDPVLVWDACDLPAEVARTPRRRYPLPAGLFRDPPRRVARLLSGVPVQRPGLLQTPRRRRRAGHDRQRFRLPVQTRRHRPAPPAGQTQAHAPYTPKTNGPFDRLRVRGRALRPDLCANGPTSAPSTPPTSAGRNSRSSSTAPTAKAPYGHQRSATRQPTGLSEDNLSTIHKASIVQGCPPPRRDTTGH